MAAVFVQAGSAGGWSTTGAYTGGGDVLGNWFSNWDQIMLRLLFDFDELRVNPRRTKRVLHIYVVDPRGGGFSHTTIYKCQNIHGLMVTGVRGSVNMLSNALIGGGLVESPGPSVTSGAGVSPSPTLHFPLSSG